MATKREVMLAGTPARLAHMLASDLPATYTPAGTSITGATLLQSNFVMLQGSTAEGQGVQLRPATGQYLHLLRNPQPFGVYVYPDPRDEINERGLGSNWYIAPQSTGFFLPSRQQWLCGTMGNDGKSSITGPASIGVAAPADATPGALFVQDVLCLAFGARPPGTVPQAGRLCFNAYWDATGQWRYFQSGPAFQLRMDAVTGGLAFHWAAAGVADAPITNWAPVTGNPIVVMGPTSVGFGVTPPADAIASSIFANYMNVPWSLGLGSQLAARINFNCYFDTNLALRYAANGPAYRIVFPSTGQTGMHVRSAPAGTTDAVLPALTEFFAALGADQITTGQTNIMLTTNEAGVVAYQQVLLGPAGSGPGGSGRALYVAT